MDESSNADSDSSSDQRTGSTPRKLTRREVLKKLGGVAAGAAATGALIPIDGISAEPDEGLSLPVSTKTATDLELFVHALEDKGYRERVKAGNLRRHKGAVELAELADDEDVIASLVDAGLAVFDFLSGERSKEDLAKAHQVAITAVKEKYPNAFDALSNYRLAAHPRYLEYAATQRIYEDWVARAEEGDFPLRRTSVGYLVRLNRGVSDSDETVTTGAASSLVEHTGGHSEDRGEDEAQATFIGAFLGALLGVGAIAGIALYATVAIATFAVLALAVIPPSVTTSGWIPAWSTVG